MKPDPTASNGIDKITEGTTYDVLSNKRRRYVVYLLKQESDRVTIGEMAERVAAWEYGVQTEEVTGDQRKRVYTALQQTHLPMMDDAGLIVFNKDRGIVSPKPAIQGIEVYRESAAEELTSWGGYYLGISSVGALLVIGSMAGVSPFDAVSMSLLATALVAVFFTSSVGHCYVHRDEETDGIGQPPEANQEAH